MSDNLNDAIDFIKELTDKKGISVVTVKDGWVFTFTREHLKSMLENMNESNHLTLFVKSSEKVQKN